MCILFVDLLWWPFCRCKLKWYVGNGFKDKRGLYLYTLICAKSLADIFKIAYAIVYVIDADVQIKLREYVWLSWVKTSNHIKLLSIEYILLENEIIIEQETNS